MDDKSDDDDYEEEDIDSEDEDDIAVPIKKKVIKINNNDDDLDDDLDDDDVADVADDEDIADDDNDEVADDESEIDIDETNMQAQMTAHNFPHLDESDEEEEEDDDTNYLQKFDENLNKNIISEWHPELQFNNSDEIDILSRVVRDANGTIIDPLHKTIPFITRYERARILGERAKQINAGAQPFVDIDESIIDGYLIALKEFEAKKIPFIIKRPLPSGGCEFWKFKDLEILA